MDGYREKDSLKRYLSICLNKMGKPDLPIFGHKTKEAILWDKSSLGTGGNVSMLSDIQVQ